VKCVLWIVGGGLPAFGDVEDVFRFPLIKFPWLRECKTPEKFCTKLGGGENVFERDMNA
jgi:hypothetical protein